MTTDPGPSVVTPPPTFDAMLRDPSDQFSDPTLTDAVIRYATEGEPPMTDPYTWETRLCDDRGMVSQARIDAATKLGVEAARLGKEVAVALGDDVALRDLRDCEKRLAALGVDPQKETGA